MDSTSSLSVFDYVLFVLVLVISFLIGIYYGFFSRNKQNTPDEYILGSRNMDILPVAISLVVTFVSSSNIIGYTADIYTYGTHHWQYSISFFVMTLVTSFVFLPVFFELQLRSCFSYLELRFHRVVQVLASFINLMNLTIFVSVNIYVPALVLNHVSGLSIFGTVIVLGSVCIFYTSIGGFRAIIWADLFQAVLMVGCCCVICYVGFGLVGGVQKVWEAAHRGGRLILFDFNPDPTIRLTTWTLVLGHSTMISQTIGLTQTSVQRFLSMSNIARARKALYLFYFGFMFFMLLLLVLAMIIYAYYETCDPLQSGLITKIDHISSFFVTKIADHVPGLMGLFVAGIFAGCLSTMSSLLNSSTVTLYEDFLRPLLPPMSNEKTCMILKILTLVLGCVDVALVFVVEKLGSIYVILITVASVTNGTLLGLFSIGMLLPKTNLKGALAGTMASTLVVGSIIIGSMSKTPDPPLPMRTDGCQHNFTTSVTIDNKTNDDLPWIFRISFMYYATVGFLVVYLVGYPVSLLTGGNEITDQRLLAPFRRMKSPPTIAEELLLSRVVNESNQPPCN